MGEVRGERPGGGPVARRRGVSGDAGPWGMGRARVAPSASTEWLR